MRRLHWLLPILLVSAALAAPPAFEKILRPGPVKPRSFSKLAFSPDGILFVGDSIGGRIFALDLDDRKPAASGKLEVADLEGKVAGLLGVDSRDLMIHSMAVNPISKNVYITASRGKRGIVSEWQLPNDVANASALLRVMPSGDIQEVRLDSVKHSFVDLSDPVDTTSEVPWKKTKRRVDAISDMVFADGKLYVAGLSNEEFSSTMRVYPFPFDGPGTATSLKIYHGSHGHYESDAPIYAFLPFRVHDKPYLIATYLCTPLVLFPLDDLKDKKHVKGTTIAELGSGNYPLDMVAFKSEGKDYIMILNTDRGVLLIDTSELAKPLPAITSPTEGTAGLAVRHMRDRGVLQVENYGDKQLLMLSRNSLNGEVRLSTVAIDHLL